MLRAHSNPIPATIFRALTTNSLHTALQAKGLNAFPIPGLAFLDISPPHTNSKLALQQQYKPNDEVPGYATLFLQEARSKQEIIDKLNEKMHQANFFGMPYDIEEASLKLHISLNHIGNISTETMLNFMTFLDKQSQQSQSLRYHFKIIKPELHDHDRFRMNDQITIYFDKYSSLGDIIKLANNIKCFLKDQGIPDNTQKLGPKDTISLTEFVTARFDTNKLTNEYDVYHFFDNEIKKFIEANPTHPNLKDIPLFALDVVFFRILTELNITVPNQHTSRELSTEDSQLVQAEFLVILNNPHLYLTGTQSAPAPHYDPNHEEEYFKRTIDDIEQINAKSEDLSYLIEKHDQLLNLPNDPEFIEMMTHALNEEKVTGLIESLTGKLQLIADAIENFSHKEIILPNATTPTDPLLQAAADANKAIAESDLSDEDKSDLEDIVDSVAAIPEDTAPLIRVLNATETKNSYLPDIVKATLISLLGVALIVTSITLGVLTFGMSSPFSILGLIAGVGLLCVGIGVGVNTWRNYRKDNPIGLFAAKTSFDDVTPQSPRPQRI